MRCLVFETTVLALLHKSNRERGYSLGVEYGCCLQGSVINLPKLATPKQSDDISWSKSLTSGKPRTCTNAPTLARTVLLPHHYHISYHSPAETDNLATFALIHALQKLEEKKRLEANMTEVSFAKSFLSTLDNKTTKYQPDHQFDPATFGVRIPVGLSILPNA